MDTLFEDISTDEDYERFCVTFPPWIHGICHYHMEAERELGVASLSTILTRILFDCIENDTELMECFFGWLDEVVLNLEHVKNACLYYLINSPDDKGKKGNRKELNRLEALCNQVITMIILVKV
ncbi:MAG: hypothetical protein ACLUHB_05765 [Odoribacter splanchnicus]